MIEVLRRPIESALHAPVGVVDQVREGLVLAGPDGHLQGVESEIGLEVGADAPAHDHSGEHVGDEGDIGEAGPGGHVGDVGHPQLVGGASCKGPFHQVWSLAGPPVRNGGSPAATPNPSAQSHLAHQTFHAAAGHLNAFPL
jgi:hypothetical protein